MSPDRRLTMVRGRGSAANPPNRFERLEITPDESLDPADHLVHTQLFRDFSKSVITRNQSPDIPVDFSLNPYRGCEHGCAYCYARPTHEYLGFSAGLDFESKIVVKSNAPELLRRQLSNKGWRAQPLLMSGVTDPYQPVERRLQVTRRCLEVLAEFRNPVFIITKNHLVTRDLDVLSDLADHDCAAVTISITTLRNEIQRVMEPRTSIPARRLDAVSKLSNAGVPVHVNVAPIVPGLTDHEIPGILEAAASAGARSASYIMLRLPLGIAPLFEAWLEAHFPDRKEKVLNRIRSLRNGKLNDSEFGLRMKGRGPYADQIRSMFNVARRAAGLEPPGSAELSTEHFRRPGIDIQTELFSNSF